MRERYEQPRDRQLTLVDDEQRLMVFDGSARDHRSDDDEDVINLRDYWEVVVRRKRTVGYFFVFVLVATLIGTFLVTPVFRSTLVLQIERESAKVVDYQDDTPNEGSAFTRDFYQTQYELLQSRTLARRVIDELGLESVPAFVSSSGKSFFSGIAGAVAGFFSDRTDKDSQDRPINIEQVFLDSLSVAPVRNSRLVHIHYDSPDPELAARVANAVANNFVNTTLERRFDASSYAKNFLEEQIKLVRANLEDSERKLAEYAREREILDVDQKEGFLTQKLNDLNKQLVAAEAERIEAETEFEEMQRAGGHGHLRILDDPVIQLYKESLANLEAEYQQYLSVFKPAYPKMVKLRSQINEMTSSIEEEVVRIRAAVLSKYKAAVREEALLNAKMAEQKNEILDLQNRSTDYQTLKRDVETNRKLYDGLLQRMKEVGVAAGVGTNNISIVDAAQVPLQPFKPSLPKNLLFAIVIGLLGGIGLAFLFEHLDDSIKSSQDLENKIGLAVLGVVPEVRKTSVKAETVALLAHEDPKSTLAEAYRSFRTALSFSTSDGMPRLLQVTSAAAGEGKTTTAISTAIAVTQTGKQVLLIDADLRNPSLHKELVLPNTTGLTNYLAGDFTPARIVQKTRVKGLWTITTGPLPPNPAELLSSGKMVDLLDQAEQRFDMVIVDSPPVLGLADSLILANMNRATVLVVDAGVTRQGSVAGAVKRLRGAQANMLGAVLTKFGQSGSGYGYDYDYGYNYHQNDVSESKGKLAKLPS